MNSLIEWGSGPLCRAVLDVLDTIDTASTPSHLRDQLVMERQRLQEPLRVAVAGRVSAGKSTLVNALLGVVMAPTGAAETTRIVTWYERGRVETAEVLLRDGTLRQLFLREDGGLPDTLGVSLDEAVSLTVAVPAAPLLADLTVVDTPGIASVRREVSERTERAVLSGNSEQPVEVDALIFLLHGQQDEVQAIEDFRTSTAGLQASVLNVVGVVSKADQLGDPLDPLGAAGRKARRLAEVLRLQMVDVVPLIGLLAETARTTRLRRKDVEVLREIATSDVDIDTLLLSCELFLDAPDEEARTARRRLLALFGLYGVRVAIGAIRQGVSDCDELGDVLLTASGFARLEHLVHRYFVPRADAIKADRTLAALNRLTYQIPEQLGARIRADMERLVLDPAMHALREVWALQQCSSETITLPRWLRDDLLRLTGTGTRWQRAGVPEGAAESAVQQALDQCASRLDAYRSSPLVSEREAEVAEVLLRSCSPLRRGGRPSSSRSADAARRASSDRVSSRP